LVLDKRILIYSGRITFFSLLFGRALSNCFLRAEPT
jgi:hypothetical protein